MELARAANPQNITERNFALHLSPKELKQSPHLTLSWALRVNLSNRQIQPGPHGADLYVAKPIRMMKDSVIQLSWATQ
jgi:hypothetical protein